MICEREMTRAAQEFKVPLAVLFAVGLTETGQRGRLRPYMLNVDGRAIETDSAAAAEIRIAEAQRAGARFIDVGCMQINLRYHAGKFISLRHMLQPRDNVRYAARLLMELRGREATWTMAVARYNAGPNNNPAQKKYICAVIGNLIASRFGAWTPAARSFCGT